MTVVRISRARIVKAIEAEPVETLRAGSWVYGSCLQKRFASSTECSVCAVGAVLRRAVLAPRSRAFTITDAANAAVWGAETLAGDFNEELENDRYMAALSCFFESQWSARGLCWDSVQGTERSSRIHTLRADTARFVAENFPRTIDIDIDGARPAKDVRVVKAKKK